MNDLNEEFVRLFERLFHDLRSPVNTIVGFSNLVRDGAAGPTTDRKLVFLDYLLSIANQLLAIIDNNELLSRSLIMEF